MHGERTSQPLPGVQKHLLQADVTEIVRKPTHAEAAVRFKAFNGVLIVLPRPPCA